jgi:hypothetical protein
MAFDGYFIFDGSEVINVARTEQYAKNLGARWLRPQYNNDSLGYMVGDGPTYKTPLLDDAPWVDEDLPESLDFLGAYPLGIDGLESATRQAVVFESIGNGGVVRNIRHGTKSMVFNIALCAVSEEGAEYGIRWLKQVLNGSPCGGGTNQVECSGADLCYLSAAPQMELPHPLDGYTLSAGTGSGTYGEGLYGDGTYGSGSGSSVVLVPPATPPYFNPEPCLTPYLRTLRNVTVTQGPVVTGKRLLSDGSAVWIASFTAVAGTPYEFGAEVPIIEGFMGSDAAPWAPGITGGQYTSGPYVVQEVQCPVPTYKPVYDPLCPAVIPPPPPASVAMGCFPTPKNWYRRHITIPEANIPLWGDVVPKIEVHADTEVRGLRLRFYADPYNTNDPNVDPCAYCGDILISYVPSNSTLVFDAVDQEVYIQYQGAGRRRADSLVFKTDGTPFEWPVLSCGMSYIVTFDMPQTQVVPRVDLSLTPRVI